MAAMPHSQGSVMTDNQAAELFQSDDDDAAPTASGTNNHAAAGRARGAKGKFGSGSGYVPNLQNLLPVPVATQLTGTFAATGRAPPYNLKDAFAPTTTVASKEAAAPNPQLLPTVHARARLTFLMVLLAPLIVQGGSTSGQTPASLHASYRTYTYVNNWVPHNLGPRMCLAVVQRVISRLEHRE